MHSNSLPDAHGPVRISDPGDLIAAIPALLGFWPRRSLVVVCLGGGDPSLVRAVMRHDLPSGGVGSADRDALDRIVHVCGREEVDSVVAVVVDERANRRGTHNALVDELGAGLAEHGIPMIGAHVLAQVTAGQRWRGLLGDMRRGVLPDPEASEVALAQVLSGRAIRGSREELEAILEPDPVRDRQRLAVLIGRAHDRAGAPAAATQRERLEFVLGRIADLASSVAPTDDDVADLAVALADVRVRDSLLCLAVTDEADAAEQLWILLARALPDRDRAEAAALLGFSAYARGDGPMAGVAFAAALGADPDHRLAALLDDALQSGVRPESVCELAATGRDVAGQIGVRMPPPVRC
ncbi:DUF4192 domain-containing protein [Rhodococcus spelaei]|uniref:DUF4192 domain-containing protein n=2 Tax=Rhodococcus spelaei TaxID=2546320 RepID=A0A541B2G9_9NOCA|nr:DUF4192 domain-containing protein [Rhodococcus spelaei]